jgi:hypothetical protein
MTSLRASPVLSSHLSPGTTLQVGQRTGSPSHDATIRREKMVNKAHTAHGTAYPHGYYANRASGIEGH